MNRRAQFGNLVPETLQDLIQVLPGTEPPPTLLYGWSWNKRLEVSLRSSFVVHQRPVTFSKRGCREDQVRASGCATGHVIQSNHVTEPGQEPIHKSGGRPAVQIVFENNERISFAFERSIE